MHHPSCSHLVEEVQHGLKEMEKKRNCQGMLILSNKFPQIRSYHVVGYKDYAVNSPLRICPIFDIHESHNNGALEAVSLVYLCTPPWCSFQAARQIGPRD